MNLEVYFHFHCAYGLSSATGNLMLTFVYRNEIPNVFLPESYLEGKKVSCVT